jgi:hypothetical protein
MVTRSKDFVTRQELDNYFDKKELFSGLSNLETLQARKNLGIINYTNAEGFINAIQITYAALNELYKGNTLAVGARYLITDYQTIYQSIVLNSNNKYVTNTGSNTYTIACVASTSGSLDPRVTIVEHPKWIVEYNILQETLSDGTTTKGKITYLKDENSNSAYYDFKSIKFRRTQSDLLNSNLSISTPYIDLYTFSDIQNGVAIDNSNYETTAFNTLKDGCTNNVFIGDTYNNIFESNCTTNTFLNGCHDSYIGWDSTSNFFNEQVCYITGAINSKSLAVGNTTLSSSISKTIHKVNDKTIVSYLDPTTYSYQIVKL